jgi:hypothetical protein
MDVIRVPKNVPLAKVQASARGTLLQGEVSYCLLLFSELVLIEAELLSVFDSLENADESSLVPESSLIDD